MVYHALQADGLVEESYVGAGAYGNALTFFSGIHAVDQQGRCTQTDADTGFDDYLLVSSFVLVGGELHFLQLFYFLLLIIARSNTEFGFAEFGIKRKIFLRTQAARHIIADLYVALQVLGVVFQIGERHIQRRDIADANILFAGIDEQLQGVHIHIADLRHQQERSAPTYRRQTVLLHQKLMFGSCADASLGRDAYVDGTVVGRDILYVQRPHINRVEGFEQFGMFIFEFFQYGAHQYSLCGKKMSAAIQSRFDAVFRYPQSLLGEEHAMYQGRTIVAYFQNDLLLQTAVAVGIEIGEGFQIGEQIGIETCRKYHSCLKLAVGKAAQGCMGIVIFAGQLFAIGIVGLVELGHDVDIDAAATDVLCQPACYLFLGAETINKIAYAELMFGRKRKSRQIIFQGRAVVGQLTFQFVELCRNQLIHKIEPCSDAPGAIIFGSIRNGGKRNFIFLAIENTQFFYQYVVGQR